VRLTVTLCILLAAIGTSGADEPRLRIMLHGGFAPEPPAEEYLRFVEEVKPDIVILGCFDQRLYALAADPKRKASPEELLAKWREVAERLHRKGIRLIGQMEINVVSDRPADAADRAGWFGYYERHWDERRLGARPARTMFEMLERPDLHDVPPVAGIDVTADCGCRVNTRALRGCLSDPSWRLVQKRMVSAAIAIGVDGFITNRNFFNHCACEPCQAGFRRWLTGRHDARTLRERFGIDDVNKATCVVGEYRLVEQAPDELVLEKLRFAKHLVHDYIDDVYLRHGRSSKGDLFVSQWNHMAYFDELHLDKSHLPPTTRTQFAHACADERWSLPPELWGRGENLIWYCNWGTTQNTILAKEYAGDTVLYAKLIRALAQGKPFVVNKYDFYRPRVMMAEAAALGYATNAIATPWQTEEDRVVVQRYFAFLRKHEALYRPADSWAEVGLLFPRRAIHAGDASSLEYVEAAGRMLVRGHHLFDIIPDDMLKAFALDRYRALIVSAPEYLTHEERQQLSHYAQAGGKLFQLAVSADDRARPGVAGTRARQWPPSTSTLHPRAIVIADARTKRSDVLGSLYRSCGENGLSTCAAPWTVEMHAYHQPDAGRLIVHLVNYNHNEKATGKSVAAREAPIAADPVTIRVRLPADLRARSVHFHTPDHADAQRLPFTVRDGFIEVQTPGFLTYGILEISKH
jgi:hypothetical protein